MKTSKTYKRIDSILDAEWEKASKAGDRERLAELRDAFERNELGQEAPLYLNGLTENQNWILQDSLPDGDDVLSSGASWLLFKDAEAALSCASALCEDSLIYSAIGNCTKELTWALEDFIMRSVTNAVEKCQAKVEKAVALHAARGWTSTTA